MRESLLGLVGLFLVAGCDVVKVDAGHRTVLVEVTSAPSGLLMTVAVGTDPVVFEATTPISRDVRAGVRCTGSVGISPVECEISGAASVKGGDPAGKRVTMCLTDSGKQSCATGNDGQVAVSLTAAPD